MYWELKKDIGIFQFIIILLLIIYTGRLIYTQMNNGSSYFYGDATYYATGAEMRAKNREIAEKYSGKVIDDDFFIEFNYDIVESAILDKDGNARFEKWLYGTSLYEYYECFSLGKDHMIGDPVTDVESVFKIDKPVFKYTDGWNVINNCLSLLVLPITFCCIILFSSLFTNEYSSGMINLIHTTDKGRNITALRKYAAGIFVSSVIYIIFVSVFTLIILNVWGADNPEAEVQLLASGKYISLGEDISCIRMIVYRLICGWLNLCGALSMTMAISSLSKNPYASVIFSLGIYFIPYIIKPSDAFSILNIMPYSICDAFSTNWAAMGSSTLLMIIYIISSICWCGISLLICIYRFNRYPMKKNGR